MSSSEDNLFKEDVIKRFEQTLRQLLKAHAVCQKQIIALKKENKALKALLEPSESTSKLSTTKQPSDADLLHKINEYISAIDDCLAYFEEV